MRYKQKKELVIKLMFLFAAGVLLSYLAMSMPVVGE